MFPLCFWTVHMSQGVHVWSLHGSISCTHWNILHFYILRKKKMSRFCKPFWIMQAIWKPQCGLQIQQYPCLTLTKRIFWSDVHRKWTSNPFGIFGITTQTPSFSSHTKLDPYISSGNGPQLSDQLVHTCRENLSTYIVLEHNDRWLLWECVKS